MGFKVTFSQECIVSMLIEKIKANSCDKDLKDISLQDQYEYKTPVYLHSKHSRVGPIYMTAKVDIYWGAIFTFEVLHADGKITTSMGAWDYTEEKWYGIHGDFERDVTNTLLNKETYMEASHMRTVGRKQFEQEITERFGNVESHPYDEKDYDDKNSVTPMWLYYLPNYGRHVATWCQGEGWEFPEEVEL